MKSCLVVSGDKEVRDALHACFDQTFTVNEAVNTNGALEILRKKRHDFIMIDLALLR